MRRISAAVVLTCGAALFSPPAMVAQFGRGGSDWTTAGGDAHRSGWVATDPKISVARMSKPGFELTWKINAKHETGPMTGALSRYIGYRGFRSLAYVASASGDLMAIDTDLGRIEWSKMLPMATIPPGGPAGCTPLPPEPTRTTVATFPAPPVGRGAPGLGMGRSGGAKSAVGLPDEGGVTIAEIAARAAAGAGRGAAGAPFGANAPFGAPGGVPGTGAPGAAGTPGRGPGPGGFQRGSYLDVLSSDGMLHHMYVSNGEEPAPPIPFLDRGAHAQGLIVINNVAYVATSHGCGGVPNGIWALDLASKETVHWSTDADIAGEDGAAFGPDGTVYAAITNGDLVALDGKTLQLKATYRSGAKAFVTSPLVFQHKTKTMLAAAGEDNRIHLVDADSLTGAAYDAKVSGPLATWKDGAATEWIVAPTSNGIATWKIADQGDAPMLQPGWTSRELVSPLRPILVNGVVFAVSNSPRPVLYAFDGESGKELWNSGKIMTAQVRSGRLTGSDSQVYLETSDGTIYAFGFPIEH